MGRYKYDREDVQSDPTVEDDPIVKLARSWISLKRSFASFSFSDAARTARDEVVSGRTMLRMRIYAQDTYCFHFIRQSLSGIAGAGAGGVGRTIESFSDSFCKAFEAYRSHTHSAVGVGGMLLLLGIMVLVTGGGGGIGGGGFVDPAVGVEGCPDQGDAAMWRHSCQPQWTGDVHGKDDGLGLGVVHIVFIFFWFFLLLFELKKQMRHAARGTRGGQLTTDDVTT